jgi:hypothetical protein
MNTSVIIFLLNHNGIIFSGDYKDFERGWYGVVGSALCMNMLLNSFVPSLTSMILAWLAAIKRCPCSTRKLKHQEELLQAYENPPFDIASKYAQIVMTVFATLIYSPGLPIINFFAAIYFFITFWVEKYVVLRHAKRPPMFDTDMPKQASSLLILAVPLHLFFAIAMYSHPCTFPSKALGGSLGSLADSASDMANKEMGERKTSLSDRVSRESTWMFFVAFCIFLCLVVFAIIKLIVGATVGNMLRCCWECCSGCCRKRRIVPEPEEIDFDSAWEWEKCSPYIDRITPPASYRMSRNPDMVRHVRILRAIEYEATSPKKIAVPTPDPPTP